MSQRNGLSKDLCKQQEDRQRIKNCLECHELKDMACSMIGDYSLNEEEGRILRLLLKRQYSPSDFYSKFPVEPQHFFHLRNSIESMKCTIACL